MPGDFVFPVSQFFSFSFSFPLFLNNVHNSSEHSNCPLLFAYVTSIFILHILDFIFYFFVLFHNGLNKAGEFHFLLSVCPNKVSKKEFFCKHLWPHLENKLLSLRVKLGDVRYECISPSKCWFFGFCVLGLQGCQVGHHFQLNFLFNYSLEF